MADVTNIMALQNLQVHFPGRGGMFGSLFGRTSAQIRALDGVDLTIRRGEILNQAAFFTRMAKVSIAS